MRTLRSKLLLGEKHIGVMAIKPLPRTWKYTGPEVDGTYLNVKRLQLPLAPAHILPLYSMQGMTADPGLVAHWVIPPRLSSDIKWLIVYVTLSRPRGLKHLQSIGLSSQVREIIEAGPPEELVRTVAFLFGDKATRTREAAKAARVTLGWN